MIFQLCFASFQQQIQNQLQNLFEKQSTKTTTADPFANTNTNKDDLFGGTADVFQQNKTKADAFGMTVTKRSPNAFATNAKSATDPFGMTASQSGSSAFESGTDLFGNNSSASSTDVFRQTSVTSNSSTTSRTPTMTGNYILCHNL